MHPNALRRLHAARGAVHVTGTQATGKTTLLDQFAHARQAPCYRGRALPWEQQHDAAALDQLCPATEWPDDPLRAAQQLATRLDQSSAVLLDDAQWADGFSLRTLGSLTHHHRDLDILVILASTTGADHAAAESREIIEQFVLETITLGAITAEKTTELARARGLTLNAAMATRLVEHTGGALGHIIALLEQCPPTQWTQLAPRLPAVESVRSRVRTAVDRCSDTSAALAVAAAVLGPDSEVRDVVAIAEITGDPLSTLDEACRAGLLRTTPGRVDMVSPFDPMVRSVLLAGLTAGEHARLHRAAAELVTDPARKLRFLVAASTTAQKGIADQLDDLACERAAEGAWADAAALLNDAGGLTADPTVRESRVTRAVDALIDAGDVHAATALVPQLESLRETPLRNAVLGYLAVVRGRAGEAQSRLDRAWRMTNVERQPDVAAVIAQRHVLHALSRYRPQDVLDWADRAIDAVGGDSPVALQARAIRGLGVAGQGRNTAALAEYDELSAEAQGAQVQRVVMARGWVHLSMGALDMARIDLERAIPTTYLGGSTRISLWARAWLSYAQFLAGDWQEAIATSSEAEKLLHDSGIALLRPLVSLTSATVLALRGDPASAQRALRHCEANQTDYEIMRIPAAIARAHVAEARADFAAVLRALHPLAHPHSAGPLDSPGLLPWHHLFAEALIIEGRLEQAQSFLTEHEEYAQIHEHPALARLAAARGKLCTALGDITGAIASFGQANERLAGTPMRFDRARIAMVHGQSLRRLGKRRESDRVLKAARDDFAAMDALVYLARCDRELNVHTDRSESGVLTSQERLVAGLVIAGRSNRDIATELFLSPKTVQYHLTHVYAKLGVRTRTELTAHYPTLP